MLWQPTYTTRKVLWQACCAWRECICYQRLHLPPSIEEAATSIFTLSQSKFRGTLRPKRFCFRVRKMLFHKPSDAITVCILESYTEVDASTISSHIFHRCRVCRKWLRQSRSVRKIFMRECKLAADVGAATICVCIATKEDAAKFLFPTCFQFLSSDFSFPFHTFAFFHV